MSGIEGPGVVGGNAVPITEDVLTVTDETATLPNSRALTAGTNITLSTATPGELIVNASGGAPGGSNTDVQFNNSGVFGGSNIFTWVSPTLTVTTPAGLAPG